MKNLNLSNKPLLVSQNGGICKQNGGGLNGSLAYSSTSSIQEPQEAFICLIFDSLKKNVKNVFN